MRNLLILAIAFFAAACQSSADKLVGSWKQIGGDSAVAGMEQQYFFRKDKTYRWTILRLPSRDTMQNVTGGYELSRGTIHFSDDDTARKATGSCSLKFESANRMRLTEQDSRHLSVLFARVDSVP